MLVSLLGHKNEGQTKRKLNKEIKKEETNNTIAGSVNHT
jgi:hypothetical protein